MHMYSTTIRKRTYSRAFDKLLVLFGSRQLCCWSGIGDGKVPQHRNVGYIANAPSNPVEEALKAEITD